MPNFRFFEALLKWEKNNVASKNFHLNSLKKFAALEAVFKVDLQAPSLAYFFFNLFASFISLCPQETSKTP